MQKNTFQIDGWSFQLVVNEKLLFQQYLEKHVQMNQLVDIIALA